MPIREEFGQIFNSGQDGIAMMRERAIAWPTLLLAALVAITMAACDSGDDQQSTGGALLGGDFTLDSASSSLSLHDFQGKNVLLYFGYTHCPDVCPMTLANVGAALDLLDEAERSRVQGLFVTVDPERDSVEVVTDYARYFHPGIIGLSGSKTAIKDVARKYQVFYNKFFDQDSESEKDYSVTHADHLFLINGQGAVVDIMSHNTKPEDIVEAVRAHLR